MNVSCDPEDAKRAPLRLRLWALAEYRRVARACVGSRRSCYDQIEHGVQEVASAVRLTRSVSQSTAQAVRLAPHSRKCSFLIPAATAHCFAEHVLNVLSAPQLAKALSASCSVRDSEGALLQGGCRCQTSPAFAASIQMCALLRRSATGTGAPKVSER